MERKSGSSSRSPSLTRRPSLKEKKGVTMLVKAKKKGASGGKKERWLLTRKTWRYMTDAVGNLLPEYRTSSRRGSALFPSSSPPISAGSGGGGGGSGSGSGGRGPRATTSPPGQLQPHQLQQWTMQQQAWVQQHTIQQSSTTSSTTFSSTAPVSSTSAGACSSAQAKPISPTSSSFPWGSFPSHRPGVTPTGPGPGQFSIRMPCHSPPGGQAQVNKYINPAVDPEDIAQVEQHFQDVCTTEKNFLLWTRTKPKALSGPALRDMKLKLEEAREKKAQEQYTFPAEEDEEEDEDDYDEYGAEDEEQITVCERRKSSTASSTISIIGAPNFFRPLPGGVGGSDTYYMMIGGPGEAQRIVRSTASQTDPFPEELLIRLRLQAVHDERQKQLQQQVQHLQQLQHQQQQHNTHPHLPSQQQSSHHTLGEVGAGAGSGSGSGSGSVGGASSTTTDDKARKGGEEELGGGEEKVDKAEDKKSEESGYSSSISDTVMKYLRIMRKNSKADNKETIDKFKTVNYDRSLRYIKSKNVTLEEALEHEKNKALGLQGGGGGGAKEEATAPTPVPTASKNPVKKGTTTAPTATSPPPEESTPAGGEVEGEEKKKVKGVKGKVGKGVVAVAAAVSVNSSSTTTTSAPSSTTAATTSSASSEKDKSEDLSPPLSPLKVTSPPKEVGIQAGESLIKYLRKLSDFSSASESPAASLSPRLSIATDGSAGVGSALDWALQHQYHQYQHTHSTTSSGIPTTTRSSFDVYSNLGDSSSDWEDQWVQQLLQYQQLFQQQDSLSPPQQQQQQKSGAVLSPIPASATGSSGSSGSSGGGGIGSGHGHKSSSYSPRHSQLNVMISGTTSTPSTPSGSSIMSHGGSGGGSGGGGSGSLMKSFFSSSPFSSSFGLRSSSSKKPTSTTSLVTPMSTSTPSGGGGFSSFGGHKESFPPTTSSSPNLLSLVHSSSSSSSTGFFRSSDRDLGFGGGMLSRVGSGRGFMGSKATQKGQMTLPLDYSPSNKGSSQGAQCFSGGLGLNVSCSPSSVMQKSKSSSSVVGGGGGPLSGAGVGTGASRLMSKSSRIFKSRSKSTTRGNTSSSGSAPCSWAPQGKCKWRSPSGKTMTLECTTVLKLSELERQTLQEVALEKLKALNLGVDVKIPKEKGSTVKPKRRPYLLKKKALSTGFFESGGNKRGDESKESGGGGSGAVFGISLSQCVANDRLRQAKRSSAGQQEWEGQGQGQSQGQSQSQGQQGQGQHKRSQNGSRNSVSSTAEVQQRHDDKGSTESLFWGKRGSVAAVEPPNTTIPPENLLQPPSPSVPLIVQACVEHLENYGLHTTGIFRVSTSLKRIRQLREEIDGGKEVQFGEEHSPHDVAALLKEFLRDLPDPLLCRDLYQPFLRTQKIRNRKQQLEAMQHLVQLLPPANRDTLASLLKFFAKVVANAGETRSSSGELLPGNKMEGYSLATLIAPNILPCMEGGTTSTDHTLTKERRESIDVVNYMISNHQQLFEVTPELLHDVYLHLLDTQPEGVEGLLKIKSGFVEDPLDELETSSVFEGSECGELPEGEEVTPVTRVFRRREDILHEGAGTGRGGVSSSATTSVPQERPSSRLRGSERLRGRRDSSRELEVEKGQSGAESDSSSTKSTSRWFRRTRPDKTRTSSDSGSEKVKGSKTGGGLESKRANSLDSVNVKEGVITVGAGGTPSQDRSASDQSLKVPENLNRRQSSPVIESSGVITASLKIPVPVPLNIDDTDIPFIEEDHPHHHPHRSRGRSASTDSSALIKSPPSSHTTTPISSPGRQPSSEVSSPLGFSPPGSPPYDPRTFPYEEMTARILIGSSATDAMPATHSTVTTTVDKAPAKVVTSLYLQPAANANASGVSAPSSPQLPHPQTATASVYIPGVPGEVRSGGKETKGANIGGLIKSKTADFEKLAKSSGTTSPATPTSTTTFSIAPKMRLRSQENIVLKQQFLLRQQQLQQPHPSSQEEAPIRRASRDAGGGGGVGVAAEKQAPIPEGVAVESNPPSSTTRSTGQRPLTRRRQIVSSASASAIVHPPSSSSSSSTTTEHKLHLSKSPSSSSHHPVSVTVRSTSTTPTPSTSPSRWKRSEIIASRSRHPQEEESTPSSPPTSRGPETFL